MFPMPIPDMAPHVNEECRKAGNYAEIDVEDTRQNGTDR